MMQQASMKVNRLSNPHYSRCTSRRVALLPGLRTVVNRDAAPSRDIRAAGAAAAKDGWWKTECPANMKDVNSIQELVDEMSDNQDRLVIVDFYAAWCNSCRSLFPKLKKIAEKNPEMVILKVNFDDNKQLCKSLGIKVLPFFHFYKGAEGRVDSFTASISKIQRLKDAIELHSAPFCSLEPSPGVPEFPEVHPHAPHHAHTENGSSQDTPSTADMSASTASPEQEQSNIVGFAKTNQQQPSAV